MWSREQALGGVGTPACELGVHPLWAGSVSAPSRVCVCSGRGTSENHASLKHQFIHSFNGIPCGEGPCLCPGQTKSPWGQSWPPSLAPELPRPWPTGSWVPASHQVGGGGEPSGAQDHSLLVSGPLPAAPTVAAADSAEQAGCKEGARYDGSSHECPAEPWGGVETA